MKIKQSIEIGDQGGAAYVEFLISFLPFFFMFLGMIQMALVYAAGLVVQHSANRAARAAVVVLDDDPSRYDSAARRRVSESGSASENGPLGRVLSSMGLGGSPGGGSGGSGPRLAAIRQAASMPLMAISPSLRQLAQLPHEQSVEGAFGGPMGRATGSLVYNRSAMAVTFPRSPNSESYRESFNLRGNVTTRVTYLFHCGVPLVNKLMCETIATIRLGPAAGAAVDAVSAVARGEMSWERAQSIVERAELSEYRYHRDLPGVQELDHAASDELMYLTAATGARFKVMRAEATLPLQSARYEYR